MAALEEIVSVEVAIPEPGVMLAGENEQLIVAWHSAATQRDRVIERSRLRLRSHRKTSRSPGGNRKGRG